MVPFKILALYIVVTFKLGSKLASSKLRRKAPGFNQVLGFSWIGTYSFSMSFAAEVVLRI